VGRGVRLKVESVEAESVGRLVRAANPAFVSVQACKPRKMSYGLVGMVAVSTKAGLVLPEGSHPW